ncbi:EcsC family protein [Dysgonomonas sp. HGC4]|uniref:EcsC family protein n=1 Tax=Dysgonomonas sp. HGC4 TaxID=1658009 RepID=UPI000680E57D|nr:EcsC family protein [Dysgonomonas sp. HGC4]MBD8347466.1 EcsC family protein [Dysgonomonas sp. HGC4]
MSKIITTAKSGIVSKVLEWTYARAINGFGGVDSAYQLGNDYLKSKGSIDQQVDQLIKWQVTKAASSGFFAGLGGWAIMPFALPANIASVMYIQVRMISAIAYMGGHDIQSDQVKSVIYVCMLGNGTKEIFKEMGIKAGEKFVRSFIEQSSKKMLLSVNEKVSVNIASKLGNKGLSGLGKAVPLVGGLIGGGFDAASTQIIGKVAKKIFIDNDKSFSILEREESGIPSLL